MQESRLLNLAADDHRAVTDLASDAEGVVRRARETGRPVVLTTQGREVAVLLSVEAFAEMRAASAQTELQRSIDQAEREIAAGRWIEHAEVESRLKHWATGGS